MPEKKLARRVFDIEADGFRDVATTVWCMVICDPDTIRQGKPFTKAYPPEKLNEAIRVLREADVLIGHNIVGYDLPVIWKLLGDWDVKPAVLDTLLVSRALYPERPGGHSLEAWGRRLGQPKIEFDEWNRYSQQMLDYCIGDTQLNVSVLKELEKEYGATFEGYKIYR